MEISSILDSSQSTTLASLLAGTRQQSGSTDLASALLSDNDTDADGLLSADEMGLSDSQLAQFDSDGDGLLSQAELDNMLQQHAFLGQLQSQMSGSGEGPEAQVASDLISTYDSDGDGSLSASEMGMTADELAAYDSDGDGLLSSTEIADGLKADKEAMMAGDMPSSTPPGETDDLVNQILSDLDSDGDGSLSASELGSSSLLSSLDTDGDGTVSSAELTAGLSSQNVATILEATDSSTSSASSTVASSDSSSSSSASSSSGSGSSSETDPMDTNGDGVVSTEEYEAWMAEHGFTLGSNSEDSGSDSSIRSLLNKATEAYQNQSNSFADMFLGGDNLVDQGLFGTSGLGLSATA